MPRKRQPDVVFEPVLRGSAMKRLDRTLQVVSSKEVTVTLIGESGTGKEVLARRVHELSERRRGPFVPINCAAIPESLFESELFGHERGAFTGASDRARGKIEAAVGGTLFLDEIGEMPMAMQTKLLRFLESRRFMRVGGSTKIDADVRLVCATLRPLDEEVRAGRFRADLYYRVQGITLHVPPLRERRSDIPVLLEQLLLQLSARHATRPPRLSRAVRAALIAYSWPGNVRELKNVLEMLCLLRPGKSARMADLPEPLQLAPAAAPLPLERTLTLDLRETLAGMVERIIDAVLIEEAGNRSRAARRLGVSVRTLQRRANGAPTRNTARRAKRTARGP